MDQESGSFSVCRRLLLAAVLLVPAALLSPAPAGAEIDAQSRLMARRAAKVDALRNLAEQVYGLQLDSRTTVRDFVTESDVTRTRLAAAIQGAREVDYAELPDGTAEVTVEITLGTVRDIVNRRLVYDGETIRVKGYGAPGGQPAPAPAAAGETIRAKGFGVEPREPDLTPAEKNLLAKRAGKLDALRNLGEELFGMRVAGETLVRDYVTRSDEVRTRLQAFVQGARVVSEQQLPDGSWQVEVEIDAAPVRGMLGIK